MYQRAHLEWEIGISKYFVIFAVVKNLKYFYLWFVTIYELDVISCWRFKVTTFRFLWGCEYAVWVWASLQQAVPGTLYRASRSLCNYVCCCVSSGRKTTMVDIWACSHRSWVPTALLCIVWHTMPFFDDLLVCYWWLSEKANTKSNYFTFSTYNFAPFHKTLLRQRSIR